MGPKYNHKSPYNREGSRSKVKGSVVTEQGEKRQCDARPWDKEDQALEA